MQRSLAQIIREDYNDDPVAYYEANFSGVARTELKKLSSVLYELLRKRDLLEEVKTLRNGLVGIIKSDYGDDVVKYYDKKYPMVPRGQLKRKNRHLYELMIRRGEIEHVPKVYANFEDGAFACYRETFKDYTRHELQVACPGLYLRMLREGSIKLVPLKSREQIRRETLERSRYGVNSYNYYKEHHLGLTRGRLKEVAPGLYNRMREDGNIRRVPLLKNGKN